MIGYSKQQLACLVARPMEVGEYQRAKCQCPDFSVYNGVVVGSQQKCLAHLRRHFKKVLLLSHGNNTVVPEAFLELIDEAFRQHRIQGVNSLKN